MNKPVYIGQAILDLNKTLVYSTGVSKEVKIKNVKKLQQDIEKDPIIQDQMVNLGCLLVFTFGKFLASALVTANKMNNLDLNHEQSFENKGYESE